MDIEKINNELLDFQNKCRKLPKALKEYDAFNQLKKKIDDFNETCPLLEMMANKAMKVADNKWLQVGWTMPYCQILSIVFIAQERHWKRMEELTSHTFDVESESFQLKNIMDAPLLEFRDDIEVSAGGMRVS